MKVPEQDDWWIESDELLGGPPDWYSGKFKGLDRWIESNEFELITKETPKAKATKLLRRFQDLTLDWFSGEAKRRPGAGKRLSEKSSIFGAMADVDAPIQIPAKGKVPQEQLDEATELLLLLLL